MEKNAVRSGAFARRRRDAALPLLFVAGFCAYGCNHGSMIYTPLLVLDGGGDLFAVGLQATVFLALAVALRFWLGPLADRRGTKPLMALGLAAYAVTTPLLGLCGTFAAVLVVRCVQAVGMAAGLSSGGKKPVVALYSTFMQRAVDQMIIDVALPEANVVFAFDRAGLVGDDGPTHHGVFDMVYTRMVPNMRVLAPSDEAELVHALHTALILEGPVSLRYPRGEAEGAPLPDVPEILEVGKSRTVREGDDVALLAFGRMVGQARAAAELLSAEGIECRVVDMRWVKPLDEEAIAAAAVCRLVVTVEEGVIAGGAGEGVLEVLARQGATTAAVTLGIPDRFIGQGPVSQLFADLGLNAEGIAATVREALR